MVLSLNELSLRSISNGIRNGSIKNPHILPPTLRQVVLDRLLKLGFINDPNCLELFTSVEFLTGMSSFSIAASNKYDIEFMQRLIKAMSNVLPNGEKVGDAITKLNLNVIGCGMKPFQPVLPFLPQTGHGPGLAMSWDRQPEWNWTNEDQVDAYAEDRGPCNSFINSKRSFQTILQLIAQCPNTTSLVLRDISPVRGYLPWFSKIQNDAFNRVMENLLELSIYNWRQIPNNGPSFINFNRLKTLRLERCSVEFDVWLEILSNIPNLENLQIIDVGSGHHLKPVPAWVEPWPALSWILPFSVPHLKSLEVIECNLYCNSAFVDNLTECPNIQQVHLMLNQDSIEEGTLIALANMDIDLKVKTRFHVDGNDVANSALRISAQNIHEHERAVRLVRDPSCRFKAISIFHERIDSFELTVPYNWDTQFCTVLEDAVRVCSKLTTFHVSLPQISTGRIKHEDMKRINSALIQFFGDSQRALQLKELCLEGNFDEEAILLVFKNCLNLVKLQISNCSTLCDQHLIDWVSCGGGKLTHFLFSNCRNVSIDGIVPILAKSADSLLSISLKKMDGGWISRVKEAVDSMCPNADVNFVE